ncbi:MAG: methionine--tRNA ligase [Chlamydiota bacterium]
MKEKVLITSALPYANGPLHFGHIAGAYLPADCYARYKRLRGDDVLYICGTDEYGVAITLSADLAKRTPKEHVDIFHTVIKDLFKQLNFSFDHFSRTTYQGHAETTQEFFKDLYDNGYIEEKVTDQLYSESDHRFLADRYVVGTCPKCQFNEARGDECQRCGASYEATDLINPRSKITDASLILKPTKHWFLRFDRFKEQLNEWLEKKNWKPNVVNFVKKYIEDLKSRAITRDSEWGIPVPLKEAEGKVLYVWFDAPIGYISATKEWAQLQGKKDSWKDYWLDPETKLVQFIGKDNIPFHAIFFPAMIMGQKKPYKIVDELPANEFYNLEGRQFSKSDNWTIDLASFFHKFTADQIRYVIAANAPETQDSEFTWKDFQTRCNSELLGKYGNLANRTLVFTANQCAGKIPTPLALKEEDDAFLEKVKTLAEETSHAYETFHLRKASQLIMELAQLGNVYFDIKKPWQLAKDPATRQEMENTIYCCLECIKTMALISLPIIPETAARLFSLLGFKAPPTNWQETLSNPLVSLTSLPKPRILFTRVEDDVIAVEVAKLQAPTSALKDTKNMPEQISIDDVRKLDLRVAEITHVERVAKSNKLLKLTVSLGNDQRTVVAGIGEKLEDLSTLIGQRVLLVANLKEATLMGVQSQGMLLAATTTSGLELPFFISAIPGAKVS